MKIGILTFHREINKGAVVQTYCLQKTLEEQYPRSDVEVIDYWPPGMEKGSTRNALKLSLAQIAFGHKPDYYFKHQEETQAIGDFLDEYYNLSTDTSETADLSRAIAFLKQQNHDAIFVGSDIVWSLQKNDGIPSPPNLYMLPNVENTRKIGFAASTDDSDLDLLQNNGVIEDVKDHISDFDFISVRDRYSRQRLSNFGIPKSKIHYMPDPTIVSGVSNICKKPVVNWTGDIAGVEIADFSLKKKVTEDLQENGYDVVNLLGPAIRGQSSPPSGLSVQERIGLYQQLDFLVTNRFHGSIFTLKTSDIPIVYTEQAERYPNKESKVRDLYLRLGIEDQILRYEGIDSFADNWITAYIDQWSNTSYSVDESLRDLRQHGLEQMDTIAEFMG